MSTQDLKPEPNVKKKYEAPAIVEEGGFERAVLQTCTSDEANCQPAPPFFDQVPQNS